MPIVMKIGVACSRSFPQNLKDSHVLLAAGWTVLCSGQDCRSVASQTALMSWQYNLQDRLTPV